MLLGEVQVYTVTHSILVAVPFSRVYGTAHVQLRENVVFALLNGRVVSCEFCFSTVHPVLAL